MLLSRSIQLDKRDIPNSEMTELAVRYKTVIKQESYCELIGVARSNKFFLKFGFVAKYNYEDEKIDLSLEYPFALELAIVVFLFSNVTFILLVAILSPSEPLVSLVLFSLACWGTVIVVGMILLQKFIKQHSETMCYNIYKKLVEINSGPASLRASVLGV